MDNRPRLAWLGTLGVALVLLAAVVIVGDRPRWREPGFGDPTARAVVAYRDVESPFNQWGTELYLVPLLESAYAEVAYVTQRPGHDQEALVQALADLTARYEAVDVVLAVHGGRVYPAALLGRLPPEQAQRVRLVYSTGCGDATFAYDWRAQGARAVVAHPGRMSMSPIFLVYFLRRWAEGHPLAEAVARANDQAGRRLAFIERIEGLPYDLVAETRAEASGATDLRIGDLPAEDRP